MFVYLGSLPDMVPFHCPTATHCCLSLLQQMLIIWINDMEGEKSKNGYGFERVVS